MTPLVNTSKGYSKCMEVIQLILDGEAQEEDVAYFKSNIECCNKSMEHYKFELEVRKNIKEKLTAICPPENLEDCIREKINAMCK
jgi:hypothetical protein